MKLDLPVKKSSAPCRLRMSWKSGQYSVRRTLAKCLSCQTAIRQYEKGCPETQAISWTYPPGDVCFTSFVSPRRTGHGHSQSGGGGGGGRKATQSSDSLVHAFSLLYNYFVILSLHISLDHSPLSPHQIRKQMSLASLSAPYLLLLMNLSILCVVYVYILCQSQFDSV